MLKPLERKPPPVWCLLGLNVIGYDEAREHAVIECIASEQHCHSVEGHPRGGIVQGGIISGWLDAAMSTACLVKSGGLKRVASLEIKASFLAPAHPGRYQCYGTVLRMGRSIAFMEGELRDADERLIARASSTGALVPTS